MQLAQCLESDEVLTSLQLSAELLWNTLFIEGIQHPQLESSEATRI
jgi:hypothetical protein